jgi:hypothetical protein
MAIVEAIIGMLSAGVELIAGLFVGAGETLGVIDLFGLLLALLLEMVLWLILYIKELLVSLFRWKKPSKVSKPILWRPKARPKQKKKVEEAENL